VAAEQVDLPLSLIEDGREREVGGRAQSLDTLEQRCVVIIPPRR
jgi:hypothetical protein